MKMIGNNCLLDTSIIIHSFKDAQVATRLDSFSTIYVPSIAVGELYYGAYRSANVKKHLIQIESFLQNTTILVPTAEVANLYGSVKTALSSKGKPIPENDIWIAAIALYYQLSLFTTDKHFSEVEAIVLV